MTYSTNVVDMSSSLSSREHGFFKHVPSAGLDQISVIPSARHNLSIVIPSAGRGYTSIVLSARHDHTTQHIYDHILNFSATLGHTIYTLRGHSFFTWVCSYARSKACSSHRQRLFPQVIYSSRYSSCCPSKSSCCWG